MYKGYAFGNAISLLIDVHVRIVLLYVKLYIIFYSCALNTRNFVIPTNFWIRKQTKEAQATALCTSSNPKWKNTIENKEITENK